MLNLLSWLWSFLGYPRRSPAIAGYLGLVYFTQSWSIFLYLGLFWATFGCAWFSWPISDYLGLSQLSLTISVYQGLLRLIQDISGYHCLSSATSRYVRLSRAISGLFSISQIISGFIWLYPLSLALQPLLGSL